MQCNGVGGLAHESLVVGLHEPSSPLADWSETSLGEAFFSEVTDRSLYNARRESAGTYLVSGPSQ